MNKGQKIGIFAGSFDPVHAGHIQSAKKALADLRLDMVYFVVEPRPRFKQGVKAFEHRSTMMRLAIAEDSSLKQIVIDEPYCTTAETIPMLMNRFEGASLYILMGDDVVRRISEWSNRDELFNQAELVVLRRKLTIEHIKAILDKVSIVSGKKPTYHIVENPLSPHSSTEIKQALKAGKQPEGLHPDVLAYAKAQNIYGSSGVGS